MCIRDRYCKEQLEQQKQELGQFVESTIQPGIREWLTVHLGKSRLAIVARKHLNLFDRLNGILNDIDDSTGTLECLAAENAFIEGFKAGVRFNNDLKAWATSDEPN